MTDLRALTLKQLRAHEATVRHGSVTAASRELLVTPPAITAQLKSLEDLVGSPLYDRTQDGFAPTEIGRIVLQLARDVDRLVGHAGHQIRALRSGATGSIVFGAVSTAKYIVPAMVARFQAAHPGISVQLVIGNRDEILRGLERNQFDTLVMGRPPEHMPLEARMLADHPHVLIAPPSHPLAGRDQLEPDDLCRERFLSREVGSGTRTLMQRFLARMAQQNPPDVVEMGTNETIKQAVMVGLGIALISRHTCLAELDSGKLVTLPVTGLPIIRQWYLVRRTDQEPSSATEVFCKFVVQNARYLVPGPPAAVLQPAGQIAGA
jgi:LysR family transcriptional regulator, low CO2-responsive transcriptional regulator